MMRSPTALVLLAGAAAAAIEGLGPCQSRCYDMAAELVGCGKDDLACQCAAFDSRLAPQMSSCMIEGCAFGDDGPTMSTEELKKKVCGMTGQSTGESTSGKPTGGSTTPSTPSATEASSSGSQKPDDTTPKTTSREPSQTGEPKPEPTDGGSDGGADDDSGAMKLPVGGALLVSLLGYLAL